MNNDMKIIIPFDFNKVDNRYDILNIIITSILHRNDVYLKPALLELVDDDPNGEEVFDYLYNMCLDCYEELNYLCYNVLHKLYLDEYNLIDAEAFGSDTILILENIGDNEYETYYLKDLL